MREENWKLLWHAMWLIFLCESLMKKFLSWNKAWKLSWSWKLFITKASVAESRRNQLQQYVAETWNLKPAARRNGWPWNALPAAAWRTRRKQQPWRRKFKPAIKAPHLKRSSESYSATWKTGAGHRRLAILEWSENPWICEEDWRSRHRWKNGGTHLEESAKWAAIWRSIAGKAWRTLEQTAENDWSIRRLIRRGWPKNEISEEKWLKRGPNLFSEEM